MSRTFRRTHVCPSIAENYMLDPEKIFMTENGPMEYFNGRLFKMYHPKGNDPETIAKKTNFRYYTDNLPGNSASKLFRRFVNRAERKRVKLDLHEAIMNCLEDEFIDYRARLPYWN